MEFVPQKANIKIPILLDGHRSQLKMHFPKYANTPEDHQIICITVPHDTALWQVGDNKEQNKSFSMAITKAKQNLLELNDPIGLQNDGMIDTDLLSRVDEA